jgi:hypothetical protein
MQRRAEEHRQKLGVGNYVEVRSNDMLQVFKAVADKSSKVNVVEKHLVSLQEFFELPKVKDGELPAQTLILDGTTRTCCGKQYDWGHANSEAHKRRAMVVHQLNVVLGTVQGRRLYQGIELSGKPIDEAFVSKHSMKMFWGAECELLGPKTFKLCQTQQLIMFKTKRQGGLYPVQAQHVLGSETAVVPYDPCGSCYEPQGSSMIHWEALPDEALCEEDDLKINMKLFQQARASRSGPWRRSPWRRTARRSTCTSCRRTGQFASIRCWSARWWLGPCRRPPGLSI